MQKNPTNGLSIRIRWSGASTLAQTKRSAPLFNRGRAVLLHELLVSASAGRDCRLKVGLVALPVLVKGLAHNLGSRDLHDRRQKVGVFSLLGRHGHPHLSGHTSARPLSGLDRRLGLNAFLARLARTGSGPRRAGGPGRRVRILHRSSRRIGGLSCPRRTGDFGRPRRTRRPRPSPPYRRPRPSPPHRRPRPSPPRQMPLAPRRCRRRPMGLPRTEALPYSPRRKNRASRRPGSHQGRRFSPHGFATVSAPPSRRPSRDDLAELPEGRIPLLGAARPPGGADDAAAARAACTDCP